MVPFKNPRKSPTLGMNSTSVCTTFRFVRRNLGCGRPDFSRLNAH